MSRTTTNGSLSPACEDYLRAILTLAGEGGATTVCALAERLAVARPSASQMVRRLAELEFVDHDPYGAVRLSATGLAHARDILRRYELIESYLVTTLGYDPTTVATEADRIEHALSERLTARIAAQLKSTIP